MLLHAPDFYFGYTYSGLARIGKHPAFYGSFFAADLKMSFIEAV
jgi:hypothetical protein